MFVYFLAMRNYGGGKIHSMPGPPHLDIDFATTVLYDTCIVWDIVSVSGYFYLQCHAYPAALNVFDINLNKDIIQSMEGKTWMALVSCPAGYQALHGRQQYWFACSVIVQAYCVCLIGVFHTVAVAA